MSFKCDRFEDWYKDLRLDIQSAVNELEVVDESNKRRKKGAALQLLMRDISDVKINAGTLANKLTPTSERHDLSLSEGWHIIEIANNVSSLMTICRHKNMLLTPIVGKQPVSEDILFPIFTQMRTELSETTNLFRQSLTEKNSSTGTVSIPTQKKLKREVHEDFCAAIAMVAHLEAMMPESVHHNNIASIDERFENLSSKIRLWTKGLLADPDRLNIFLQQSDIRQSDISRFSANATTDAPDISLKIFLRAIEADKTNTLLGVFCESLGYRVFPIEAKGQDFGSNSVLQHFIELEERQADTVNRLSQAIEDKCITKDELAEISEELKEEYGTELALLNMFTELG